MKLYIETLGCKANQAESACVVDDFVVKGFEITDNMPTADVIVINTCTVTNRTDYKCRYAIKRAVALKAKNPQVVIVVTGCYSQLNQIAGVDIVIDNNHKDQITQRVLERLAQRVTAPVFEDPPAFTTFTEQSMHTMPGHSRAFVKVQDGCDMACTYCTVPLARGRSRSRDFQSTLDQIKLLLQNGYEDIVLTGINLALYRDADGRDLVDLLYALAELDGLRRIRLSSIEPQLFTERLFTAIEQIDKIAPHFHIPLQTGCDDLLKRHGRRYTVREFLQIVERLHNIKDNSSLSFDEIVGLPGETEGHFVRTYDMLNKIDFTYLHTFIYSPRKGTAAADMPQRVSGGEARQRSGFMRTLSNMKKKAYMQRLVQCEQPMLVSCEVQHEGGLWCGLSDRGIQTHFRCEPLTNRPYRLYTVIPKKLYKDGVFCEVVQ